MVLFTLLMVTFFMLIFVLATGVLTVGAGLAIAFADIIVFVLIIYALVKLFTKGSKKSGGS